MSPFEMPNWDNPLNCVICGVGGQGNVLASRILAQVLMERGEHVKTAETIGMAQKGGSVVSHVRGGRPQSPLVPHGAADVLIAFEPGEAVRCIDYVKSGGTVVVSTAVVQPSTAAVADSRKPPRRRGEDLYDGKAAQEWLASVKDIELISVDALGIAREAGSPKAANVVLLAAAAKSGALGISRSELEAGICAQVKERFHSLNLKAVELVYGM